MERLPSSPPIGLDLLPFLHYVSKELGLWKRPLHPQGELVDILDHSLLCIPKNIYWSTRVITIIQIKWCVSIRLR